MKSDLLALMNGEKSTQEIIRDYIACFTCRTDPQPDDNTTIDPELIQQIIADLRDFGGMGRRPAWYDHEANVIRGGANYRQP